MIEVVLPAHLRVLAGTPARVHLAGEATTTLRQALDALEAAHPHLRGTLRDPVSGRRRPFVRFFACQEDLSLLDPDLPLPPDVLAGTEPLLVVGAMAGG